MDIANKDSYCNLIYKAVIANANSSLDPENKGRVQIYIPSSSYRYETAFEEYVASNNKASSEYKNYFPWAISLVKDLKDGNVVYGSYIDNSNKEYIILGIDQSSESVAIKNSSYSGGTINGSDLIDLVMPIILRNEISLPVENWPNNIPDSKYQTIVSNDNNHGWSIGLIQWNATRAFSLINYIAKNDSNWKSNFSDTSINMVIDIQNSLNISNISSISNKYGSSFTLPTNNAAYPGIKNMLGSEVGKRCQREKAQEATLNSINQLQNTYNITNPAIIIFLADIMNQYGNGVNNSASYPSLKGCINKATEICNSNKSTIKQYNEYYNYWCNLTSYYADRRSRVDSYIKQLDNQGKLSIGNQVDLGELSNLSHLPESGEYLWPVPSSDQINCFWGDNAQQAVYINNKNSIYKWGGLWHGTPHSGIDIAPSKFNTDGDKCIAIGSGTVTYICTTGIRNEGSLSTARGPATGNAVCIKMDKNPAHYVCYMHFCKPPTLKVGDKVKTGDIIGYMGSTGNSTGTHLHIGIYKSNYYSYGNSIDILPYLGKRNMVLNTLSSIGKGALAKTSDFVTTITDGIKNQFS